MNSDSRILEHDKSPPDTLSEPSDPKPVLPVALASVDDAVLDAHLRRQANAIDEITQYMPTQSESERRLLALNDALAVIEMQNFMERKRLREEADARENKATAAARAVALAAEAQQMRADAKAKEAEARRLAAMVKE
jgi:hypothetical protein